MAALTHRLATQTKLDNLQTTRAMHLTQIAHHSTQLSSTDADLALAQRQTPTGDDSTSLDDLQSTREMHLAQLKQHSTRLSSVD